MWPFSKALLKTDHLPVVGPWTIVEGQRDGQVIIMRTNAGYRKIGSVSGYEHQVGIAVLLQASEVTGLPNSTENSLLAELEDIICASLEAHAESLLVAVITTGGMREFVFYTRDRRSVQSRFDELSNQIKSHKIQLLIQPDKTWDIYRQLSQE